MCEAFTVCQIQLSVKPDVYFIIYVYILYNKSRLFSEYCKFVSNLSMSFLPQIDRLVHNKYKHLAKWVNDFILLINLRSNNYFPRRKLCRNANSEKPLQMHRTNKSSKIYDRVEMAKSVRKAITIYRFFYRNFSHNQIGKFRTVFPFVK